MDRRQDPYTPGSGRSPGYLAGRDEELEEFRVLIDRIGGGLGERSIIYSGLRGVGKTVLLIEFDTIARESGWASTDVHEVGTQPDFRTTFTETAFQLLLSMSRKERMKDRARQAMGVLKAFAVQAPGGLKARIDVELAVGTADSGDPEGDLTALLVEIGEVARAGNTGALFLLDEMQNLEPEALGAICMAFHRISQKNRPVAIVGNGLPRLPRLLRQAKPYAERLFQYRDLGRLSDGAARSALVTPAARQGVEFEEDAARLIVRESDGYPYFIQEYGRVLWREVERSPITVADFEASRSLILAELDRRFFKDRFESAADSEQRYLTVMASLDGRGPYRTAEIASAGYRTWGSSSGPRDGLLRKDLIWTPRRGQVDFTVPHFADYITRNHPLNDFQR
jgi:AAA ATPase domain